MGSSIIIDSYVVYLQTHIIGIAPLRALQIHAHVIDLWIEHASVHGQVRGPQGATSANVSKWIQRQHKKARHPPGTMFVTSVVLIHCIVAII